MFVGSRGLTDKWPGPTDKEVRMALRVTLTPAFGEAARMSKRIVQALLANSAMSA